MKSSAAAIGWLRWAGLGFYLELLPTVEITDVLSM
jgi:hypothetical protein